MLSAWSASVPQSRQGSTGVQRRAARCAAAMAAALESSLAVSGIDDISSYDAVFVPGGHGVCFDMPESAALQAVLSKMADAGKVVASVCHGPAALVNVTLASGEALVSGKPVGPRCPLRHAHTPSRTAPAHCLLAVPFGRVPP